MLHMKRLPDGSIEYTLKPKDAPQSPRDTEYHKQSKSSSSSRREEIIPVPKLGTDYSRAARKEEWLRENRVYVDTILNATTEVMSDNLHAHPDIGWSSVALKMNLTDYIYRMSTYE